MNSDFRLRRAVFAIVPLIWWTPEMGASRWNGVAIWSGSRDISTSGLAAAIFKYRLPVTSGSNRDSSIEFLVPKNIDLAVGISLLPCLGAEI